ncbi:hypothetical protein AEGHOMDF_5347 [Methylobacterium soli]|nr:hypothetical protein AEGHOMDF_5347 [Methylobacterium soli]
MAWPTTMPLSTSQNAEEAKPENTVEGAPSRNSIAAAKNSIAVTISATSAVAHRPMQSTSRPPVTVAAVPPGSATEAASVGRLADSPKRALADIAASDPS